MHQLSCARQDVAAWQVVLRYGDCGTAGSALLRYSFILARWFGRRRSAFVRVHSRSTRGMRRCGTLPWRNRSIRTSDADRFRSSAAIQALSCAFGLLHLVGDILAAQLRGGLADDGIFIARGDLVIGLSALQFGLDVSTGLGRVERGFRRIRSFSHGGTSSGEQGGGNDDVLDVHDNVLCLGKWGLLFSRAGESRE